MPVSQFFQYSSEASITLLIHNISQTETLLGILENTYTHSGLLLNGQGRVYGIGMVLPILISISSTYILLC